MGICSAIAEHHITGSGHHEYLLAHNGNGGIAVGAVVGSTHARACRDGLRLTPCRAVVVAGTDDKVDAGRGCAEVVAAYVIQAVAVVAHGNETACTCGCDGGDAIGKLVIVVEEGDLIGGGELGNEGILLGDEGFLLFGEGRSLSQILFTEEETFEFEATVGASEVDGCREHGVVGILCYASF